MFAIHSDKTFAVPGFVMRNNIFAVKQVKSKEEAPVRGKRKRRSVVRCTYVVRGALYVRGTWCVVR